MNTNLTRLIVDCISLPEQVFHYRFSQSAVEHFYDRSVLITSDYDFDPHLFGRAGGACIWTVPTTHFTSAVEWNDEEDRIDEAPRHGLFDVLWLSHRLQLLLVTYEYESWWAIAADSDEITRRFFEVVCRYCLDQRDELIECREGRMRRSERLAKHVCAATLDDMTLSPDVRKALEEDILKFFDAADVYDRYGIPWKRGVLLHGPPGNGKTRAIRALLNQLQKPAIVVRSIKGDQRTEAQGLSAIFRRAREMAPSVVVFEDVDSVISSRCLSSFLNELDGIVQNRGVLTIATTNYPDRLDPALRDRPSRFDRKIEFASPSAEIRRLYLSQAIVGLDASTIDRAVEATKGHSFASLQELRRSALMAWIGRGGEVGDALLSLLEPTRKRRKRA